MIEQILQITREHLFDTPATAAATPADRRDAVIEQIAQGISDRLTGNLPAENAMLPQQKPENRAQLVGDTTNEVANRLVTHLGFTLVEARDIAQCVPALLEKSLLIVPSPV